MRDASDLFFIHCLTGCHPGSGTALGVVDLPVQRERHTRWPVIPGSSLKGVLRSACRSAPATDAADLSDVFGPETRNASDHAGALALTDARILAFPVRSLKGVFAWTTCPAVLERMKRDARIAGVRDFPEIPAVESNRVLCEPGSPLVIGRGRLVLEEFEFTRSGDPSALADWIAERAFHPDDAATADRFRTHLAILSDDDFGHFVRHATEVSARVGLDYERKTVRDRALFYEEFLPPETLFYSLVLASASRRASSGKSADDVLGWLRRTAPRDLQIGGDETVGKGICSTRFAGVR